MSQKLNAKNHIYRHEVVVPAEEIIFSEMIRPGMNVLDVGCAATGRSARLLREFGCQVYAIEINQDAILEFGRREDSGGIELAAADMTQLPFRSGFFDVVLIAFHGMDYLLTESIRQQAWQEFGRVLGPNGRLIFNAFNRWGIIFSPQGLFSPAYLKVRAKHMLKGAFLKPTFTDINNLELHQASLTSIVREVNRSTGLDLLFATNQSGRTRNRTLLSVLASAPYYVFG